MVVGTALLTSNGSRWHGVKLAKDPKGDSALVLEVFGALQRIRGMGVRDVRGLVCFSDDARIGTVQI